MAGGFKQKSNSKNKSFINSATNSELLHDTPTNYPNHKINKSGILTPGQSIDFNPSVPETINWNKEFLTNSIDIDQKLIIQRQNQETSQSVEEVLLEIKKLVIATQELSNEITNIPLINIPENNQYQLSFLNRIKMMIRKFSQNISESAIWMSAFNHKRNKRNSFWNRAKNKKTGGQQYIFSGEHSASRSAN